MRSIANATDLDIDIAADDVLGLLREFNPRDASSALIIAHYRMITATFDHSDKADAVAAVTGHAAVVMELLNRGWR